MLWDFNSDEAMAGVMGSNWLHDVTWKGESDGTDDYFTFTATGPDPYVSIDNSAAEAVDDIQWVKVRARVEYEYRPEFGGDAPMLYADSVEPAQPINDIVQF